MEASRIAIIIPNVPLPVFWAVIDWPVDRAPGKFRLARAIIAWSLNNSRKWVVGGGLI